MQGTIVAVSGVSIASVKETRATESLPPYNNGHFSLTDELDWRICFRFHPYCGVLLYSIEKILPRNLSKREQRGDVAGLGFTISCTAENFEYGLAPCMRVRSLILQPGRQPRIW